VNVCHHSATEWLFMCKSIKKHCVFEGRVDGACIFTRVWHARGAATAVALPLVPSWLLCPLALVPSCLLRRGVSCAQAPLVPRWLLCPAGSCAQLVLVPSCLLCPGGSCAQLALVPSWLLCSAGSRAQLPLVPRWLLCPAGSCAQLPLAPRCISRPAASCAQSPLVPSWLLRPGGSCAQVALAPSWLSCPAASCAEVYPAPSCLLRPTGSCACVPRVFLLMPCVASLQPCCHHRPPADIFLQKSRFSVKSVEVSRRNGSIISTQAATASPDIFYKNRQIPVAATC